MAARRGIDADQVAAAAMDALEHHGRPEDVTLGDVARRLGIRTQSLYAHLDGAAGLRRTLALACLAELAIDVETAGAERTGTSAVVAILRAQLRYALAHPGRFAAAVHPPGDDPDLAAAVDQVARPLMGVLADMGLDPVEREHWQRIALSAVYGFAMLHRDGGFTLEADPADTVDRLVATLVRRPAGR
jgi:AcrR family transcriptional regulator